MIESIFKFSEIISENTLKYPHLFKRMAETKITTPHDVKYEAVDSIVSKLNDWDTRRQYCWNQYNIAVKIGAEKGNFTHIGYSRDLFRVGDREYYCNDQIRGLLKLAKDWDILDLVAHKLLTGGNE